MSHKRTKILYTIGQLTIGGTELQLLELIRNLDRDLFEARVVCLSGPAPLAISFRELGCVTDVLEKEDRGPLQSLWKLFRITKDFQPDIIHAYAYASRAVIPIAKFISNIPIIVSIRTYPDWNITFIEKIINHFADLILSNSGKAAEAVSEYWPKVPGKVVRNGIDLIKFQEDSQDFLEPIPENALLDNSFNKICVVGRLEPVKGHEDLLTAFSSICKEFSNVQLWIIGDGPLRPALAEMTDRLGIGDKVVFWGERADVPAILRDATIGVNSSKREGLSNAIMEYMAASLPVVVTNVGGNSELVSNNINGLLVPAESPQILAEKIKFLLQNQIPARTWGQNGRKFVEENLTVGQMTRKTQAVYTELLSTQ